MQHPQSPHSQHRTHAPTTTSTAKKPRRKLSHRLLSRAVRTFSSLQPHYFDPSPTSAAATATTTTTVTGSHDDNNNGSSNSQTADGNGNGNGNATVRHRMPRRTSEPRQRRRRLYAGRCLRDSGEDKDNQCIPCADDAHNDGNDDDGGEGGDGDGEGEDEGDVRASMASPHGHMHVGMARSSNRLARRRQRCGGFPSSPPHVDDIAGEGGVDVRRVTARAAREASRVQSAPVVAVRRGAPPSAWLTAGGARAPVRRAGNRADDATAAAAADDDDDSGGGGDVVSCGGGGGGGLARGFGGGFDGEEGGGGGVGNVFRNGAEGDGSGKASGDVLAVRGMGDGCMDALADIDKLAVTVVEKEIVHGVGDTANERDYDTNYDLRHGVVHPHALDGNSDLMGDETGRGVAQMEMEMEMEMEEAREEDDDDDEEEKDMDESPVTPPAHMMTQLTVLEGGAAQAVLTHRLLRVARERGVEGGGDSELDGNCDNSHGSDDFDCVRVVEGDGGKFGAECVRSSPVETEGDDDIVGGNMLEEGVEGEGEGEGVGGGDDGNGNGGGRDGDRRVDVLGRLRRRSGVIPTRCLSTGGLTATNNPPDTRKNNTMMAPWKKASSSYIAHGGNTDDGHGMRRSVDGDVSTVRRGGCSLDEGRGNGGGGGGGEGRGLRFISGGGLPRRRSSILRGRWQFGRRREVGETGGTVDSGGLLGRFRRHGGGKEGYRSQSTLTHSALRAATAATGGATDGDGGGGGDGMEGNDGGGGGAHVGVLRRENERLRERVSTLEMARVENEALKRQIVELEWALDVIRDDADRVRDEALAVLGEGGGREV